jgi:hypothetical protein
MNGEAVRPQNGFPLRLLVPGFEGIFNHCCPVDGGYDFSITLQHKGF